jgi:hypothetical protein
MVWFPHRHPLLFHPLCNLVDSFQKCLQLPPTSM